MPDQAVERALAACWKAHPGLERALVAYSAGPDSTALLLAARATHPAGAAGVVACWVNHRLRPAAELAAEQALAEAVCRRLGLTLVVKTAADGQIAAAARGRPDGGIEAAARHFRYAALEAARLESGCQAILTAHTADDQAETMVMRFMGGSGSAGLRGIPAAGNTLLRPFLALSKAEVVAYLALSGCPYSTDSTNLAAEYLRNRLRQQIMPALRTVFPHYQAALRTVAAKMTIDDQALEDQAAACLEGRPGAWWVDRQRFWAQPLAIRLRLVYRLAGHLAERLPWAFVQQAVSREKGGPLLAEGHGISLYCYQSRIAVQARAAKRDQADPGSASGYALSVSGSGSYRLGFGLSLEISGNTDGQGIRADALRLPCLVRTRRPGDLIQRRHGVTRLDSLLSSLKLSAGQRELVPVIEDEAGLVAVLGAQFGARDLYRYNPALLAATPVAWWFMELKGVVANDAI
ncbi:MAG: tRNA lysidine(34) synthetase TilS [Spirochaetes bacterium GWD1_61_31]|nr:MAG: tRNA lysidine(34) synthetase TilS [Spirochaetes bacterium GWB1_60_80]OHD30581.1 MAG: tRNA lysidine(34) synthetase TilS [Spirochaetes bacterium GWC1_61_12]OHD34850.1 MAG: tRNA lysidine(34) synthetase TilS [Spirochaetes bacterium GWD1_61_31]OHD46696.1 MAG: tRNA lysidine(34) synthetase TilS [Spirochaetes bacterium GWE1_60_18]OHD60325.1 MAG: tRNA lysidine(34) synthetase TilS [Spirochaetes bacterium GWF1_60_12]